MADGSAKPISQIKVGDKISNNLPGADLGTKNQTHTVTAIHITYDDTDFTAVTIATSHGQATITGTAHHPYWDATTRAWTDADRLHPGDRVETTDAAQVLVLATHDFTSHTIVTYNLTVDGLHTYYVEAGNTPVLVHNSSCDDAEALARAFRANPPGGAIGGNRNVAAAVWEIDGESGSVVAVSGGAPRPGTIGMPSDPVFTASRAADSEWKILENIASQISPDSEGVVHLYSELPICDSCQGVIQQFQQRFPGVTVV
jgi:hypothetical protein